MCLYVLTGPVGTGKTTLVWRLAEHLRQVGGRPGGVLELGVLDDAGRKVGIALLDIESGERHTLACSDRDLGGPRCGHFSFSPEALAWRREVVSRHPACDLLVLDEIGPLELEGEEGTGVIRAALEGGRASRVLLVVREGCLEALARELAGQKYAIFSLPGRRLEGAEEGLWAMLELGVERS